LPPKTIVEINIRVIEEAKVAEETNGLEGGK
jgi:hypothetical protein